MAITWKPAIWRASTLLELPRPVDKLRLVSPTDALYLKVPLHPGEFVEGRSENGVDIELEGRIGRQDGTLHPTEQDMLNALEEMRQGLRPLTPDTTFQFFTHHSASLNTFRSFKKCTLQEVAYDLSNPKIFSYSLRIHAADTILYVTAPA